MVCGSRGFRGAGDGDESECKIPELVRAVMCGSRGVKDRDETKCEILKLI